MDNKQHLKNECISTDKTRNLTQNQDEDQEPHQAYESLDGEGQGTNGSREECEANIVQNETDDDANPSLSNLDYQKVPKETLHLTEGNAAMTSKAQKLGTHTALHQGDKMLKGKRSSSVNLNKQDSGDSEDNPHVLDPENPLMVKFQKALGDLLKKQLLKLDEEVAELNSNLKNKAKEREDLGVNLFNLQEEVTHTQKQLESYNKSLVELEETRTRLENELQNIRVVHKEETQQIMNIKSKEENIRLQIEELKGIEWQLKQWESDYNSELAVSQRIADKTEKQKEEMLKEKQKQDILLLRIRQEVLSLESKREQLRAQRDIKLQQQESLRRTIAEASADLEALQNEQIRLTRIWNGVVVSLQQRDKVFSSVQKDLQKAKEAFHLMLSEIESYRRMAKIEMAQSEKTMNILLRLETEYADLIKANNKNKDLISELEADYSYLSGIVKQTEENFQSAVIDGKTLTQKNIYQQRELERITQKKISLETQILEKLLDQSKNDKALQHNARTIRTLKESNKTQEMSFIMMENQIAKTMVEVQRVQGSVLHNENILKEATSEAERYNNELSDLEAHVKKSTATLQNKMRLIDQLSKKLDGILARSGTTEESPQEVRIKAIEVEIEEILRESEKKQSFWLRLQSHIVRLTEERQRQLQQLNLLYKQVHILTQRALKIENETEKHKKGKANIERQLHELEVSLHKMTAGLHTKRGYKEILDKENNLFQAESLSHLKEMEKENVENEEELTSLEETNLLLNQDILDLKRECLAWEKKILLASETKEMNEEDNRGAGELNQMRVEIHRMDVRFSHLRKVQDTLVKDLEHCIMRRESLLDEADAREKRSARNPGSVSNRIVFERKLENLSNRTKQAKSESIHISSQVENELPQELEKLRASIKEAETILQKEQQAVLDRKKDVDEANLVKQQKLERLVRLQKKVRLYTKVKDGKHRLMYRTESAMEAEICKQRTTTNDLVELVAVLQQHFPSLQLQILRLKNILQITAA